MSRRIVLGIALLAAFPANISLAVTVSDQFDTSFDYLPGSVPGGGIWTRVLNPGAGGGQNQMPAVDPIPIFDANDTNAGNLTLSTFGVGFGGGGTTTAPALVREVNADLFREARVRVTTQTAGQWSQAGILVRAPGPINTVGANDNFFTYGGFRSGGTDFGGDGIAATTQNVNNGAEAELNADAATEADIQYLRVVHLGTGDFETYTSPDNSIWTLRQTILNTGLATGNIEVGLWGGTFAGSAIVGGASVAFDYIEIDEAPDAPEAAVSWTPAGSGDWNRSNWSVVGGKPDSNISVATFGAGAPLTANATVYTNQTNTVKEIQFDNATFGYTLAGSGQLLLDADAGNALITVTTGTHEIQVDLVLNDNTTVNAAVGTTLNINAPIFLNGNTFTVTPGGGTVNLNNGTFAGGGGGGGGGFVNDGNVEGLGGVEGDFTQGSGGSLAFALGSDPIQIDGDALLDGVLDVSVGDGVKPRPGRTYTVLTADSVTDLGLALGEGAGLFDLVIGEGSVSLVGSAIPEPGTLALVGVGLAAGAMSRRRRASRRAQRALGAALSAKKCSAFATFLLALWASACYAQFGTFRDDFGDDMNPHAQQFNYEPTANGVPGGGIWTGKASSENGGGPFDQEGTTVIIDADFVADGFTFNGTDKAGKLIIEDLNLHPNSANQTDPCSIQASECGSGFQGNMNNAPFLYREIPADANFVATIKVDAQTAGNWSYSPIIARLKAPVGGPDIPIGLGTDTDISAQENFVTVGRFTPAAANPVNAGLLFKSIVDGAQVMDANVGGAGNGQPLYVRLVKEGGQFQSFTSLTGDFTGAAAVHTALAPNLNQAGTLLQVGLGHMNFPLGGGAIPGVSEFDFFEITVTAPSIPLNAYWRPIASLGGSGDYNNANNWQSIEVPGIAPVQPTVTAHFENGDSVPSTGDPRVSGPVTVFHNAAITIKGLDFNSPHKYTIGGSGSITLQGDVANTLDTPVINLQQGSHEIDVDMVLARNTTVTSASGTRLDFDNSFDFGAVNRQLIVNGDGRVNFNSTINIGSNGIVNVNTGATVGGSGRINGSLNNNAGGTVAPGTSTGTLTVDGTYVQNAAATLEIELGGAAAGAFDKLIAPLITLSNGTLDVSLVNGFTPQNTDVFEIMDATATLTTNTRFGNTPVSGGPANTGVLTTADGTFLVTYDYTLDRVQLSNFVPGGLPGDHNKDGFVDVADLVAWEKSPNLFGNAGGLIAWRTNYGRSQAGSGGGQGSTTIPEPAAVGLALIAISLATGFSRGQRTVAIRW
jgi:hypothetical protein